MTDPKPKKAQKRFIANPHSLSDSVKAELQKLLCSDDDRAIAEVEKCLGLYIDGNVHMDEAPRPADYVKAFNPIAKDAVKLFNRLCELSDYFSEQLEDCGIDQNDLERILIELYTAASSIEGKYKNLSSKGARKNNALAETVRRLRLVFNNYYKGAVTGRKQKGGFQFRGDEENRELAFVKMALLSARIIPANKTYDLPKLFRDPRCALPRDRDNVIKKIANKVRLSRQKNTEN